MPRGKKFTAEQIIGKLREVFKLKLNQRHFVFGGGSACAGGSEFTTNSF